MNIHFDVIESTNTFAKNNRHLFPRDGVSLISADAQTKGRGRFERRWSADEGNLILTYCFTIEQNVQNLPQILVLSLTEVLDNTTIKWPNDLLLNGKKIAGVLCEVSDDFVALGIGINVNNGLKFFNDLPLASSLFLETGKRFDKETIKRDLTEAFKRNLRLFLEEGFAPFAPLFNEKSAFSKGQMLYSKDVSGKYAGITEEGTLILTMSDGTDRIILSGDFSSKGTYDRNR